jgi:hypothetical protein
MLHAPTQLGRRAADRGAGAALAPIRARAGKLDPSRVFRRFLVLRQEQLLPPIGLGSPADRAKDILGQVYEYLLAQFASAKGKKGGQFYTPSRVTAGVLAEAAG